MPSSPDGAVLRGDAARAGVSPYQRATLTRDGSTPAGPSTQRPQVRLTEVYAEEIARIEAQARQDGFAVGHAEGLVAAEAAVAEVRREAEDRLAAAQVAWEQQMASATAALAAAVQRLDAQSAPLAEDLTGMIAEAAFTLLGDLLGRELAVATDPGLDAIRRALALCPADAPVTVRVNPSDHARLSAEALAGLPVTVTVRPDPTVEPAGAVAEAGVRRVDAQIGAALERVRAVLAP